MNNLICLKHQLFQIYILILHYVALIYPLSHQHTIILSNRLS